MTRHKLRTCRLRAIRAVTLYRFVPATNVPCSLRMANLITIFTAFEQPSLRSVTISEFRASGCSPAVRKPVRNWFSGNWYRRIFDSAIEANWGCTVGSDVCQCIKVVPAGPKNCFGDSRQAYCSRGLSHRDSLLRRCRHVICLRFYATLHDHILGLTTGSSAQRNQGHCREDWNRNHRRQNKACLGLVQVGHWQISANAKCLKYLEIEIKTTIFRNSKKSLNCSQRHLHPNSESSISIFFFQLIFFANRKKIPIKIAYQQLKKPLKD